MTDQPGGSLLAAAVRAHAHGLADLADRIRSCGARDSAGQLSPDDAALVVALVQLAAIGSLLAEDTSCPPVVATPGVVSGIERWTAVADLAVEIATRLVVAPPAGVLQ